MAAGPFYPNMPYPKDTSGNLFPNFYQASATPNIAPVRGGLGVIASLGVDATWVLEFDLPAAIPSGTLKLALGALAGVSTGNAVFQVWDVVVAAGGSPVTTALTQETGTPTSQPSSFISAASGTYTANWANLGADNYGLIKLPLTATPVANELLQMALVFKTSGFTLAAVSTWNPYLLWE